MKVKRLLISSMFCALVFVSTLLSIPAGFGNINLGDSVILICAYFLGYYGILPSAIGAALCDIFSGYGFYAPATFIIKGTMVIIVVKSIMMLKNKRFCIVPSAIIGELFMVFGYFVYEYFILSYGNGAIVNIPFNFIQSMIGVVVSIILYRVFKRFKIDSKIKGCYL